MSSGLRSIGLAGVAVVALACGPAPASFDVIVTRTATEILFDVPGWSTVGAQVFLCPVEIRLEPDVSKIQRAAGAADCLDLGIGMAQREIHGVGVPFESMTRVERVLFDAAPRWSVVIVENPAPADRVPQAIQREIAGGPIVP